MIDERLRGTLESLVDRRWPRTRILSIDALPGDASTRTYARLHLEGPTETPAAVMAMLMEDASVALSSEELGTVDKDGPDELPFSNVARYLAKYTEAVPCIYTTSEDRTAMLLEDLGDDSLWKACSADPARTEALFTRALDLLAALQRDAVDDDSGCYAFRQAFDRRLFGWEFEHFLEYGVSDAPASLMGSARNELNELAIRLAEYPRVFCHRDYHAWNLHVQDGRIRILDFQDALMGPALYDVASLLTDRSTPQLIDEDTEQRLLDRFLRTPGAARGLDGEQAKASYHLCVLQRALKVIGRFNYLAEIKRKTSYLGFLPSTAATARRASSSLGQIDAIRTLLAEHIRGLS